MTVRSIGCDFNSDNLFLGRTPSTGLGYLFIIDIASVAGGLK